ncbi:unnamed protein product [Closterium sp. NIES-65]|nr:unnamed protein product [Closterium sp. NIES-65]
MLLAPSHHAAGVPSRVLPAPEGGGEFATIPGWRQGGDLSVLTTPPSQSLSCSNPPHSLQVSPRACYQLLREGENLLLYPGGGREVGKRKNEKYKLFWRDTTDFVRIAVRCGATIVPFSTIGVEDAFDVLMDPDQTPPTLCALPCAVAPPILPFSTIGVEDAFDMLMHPDEIMFSPIGPWLKPALQATGMQTVPFPLASSQPPYSFLSFPTLPTSPLSAPPMPDLREIMSSPIGPWLKPALQATGMQSPPFPLASNAGLLPRPQRLYFLFSDPIRTDGLDPTIIRDKEECSRIYQVGQFSGSPSLPVCMQSPLTGWVVCCRAPIASASSSPTPSALTALTPPSYATRRRTVCHGMLHPPTQFVSTTPLNGVHMDLGGPAPVRSRGGLSYFLVIIDDSPRYHGAKGFTQKQGSDFFETFSPTAKTPTLHSLLDVAARDDIEANCTEVTSAFLQGVL